MATMNVLDAAGATVAVEKPLAPGQTTRSASRPVTIASEDITALTATQTVSGTVAATQSGTWNIGTVTTLPAITGTVTVNGVSTTAPDRGAGATTAQTLRVSVASEQVEGGEYEAVPSTAATTTTLGATGAIGDFLSALIITPLTTSPGSVSIKDGSDTSIVVFQGGTTSVSNLVPFPVPVGATSRTGAWQVVVGPAGNVQALAIGNFT